MHANNSIAASRPQSEKPSSSHLDFLSGLRGLAALWVVLSHIWIFQFGIVAHDGLLGLATNWLLYSHLAVDIFIVLSGYCLMLSVARDGGMKRGALDFYKRRARRILPPYYAALVYAVLIFAFSQPNPPHVSLPAVLANIFLVQDMLLRYDILDGPLWSVAVEWRIYLLFPALVALWRKLGRRAALGAAAVFALCLTLAVFRACPQFSFACPWYVFLFALGMCAATVDFNGPEELIEGRRRGLVVAVCTSSAAVLGALLTAYPVTTRGGERFGHAMPVIDIAAGILTASFLIMAHRVWIWPRALLSQRPIVNLGLFSYSVYLIHAPLLSVMGLLARRLAGTGRLSTLQFGILAPCELLGAIGVGYLFFLFFERPFLNTKQPIGAQFGFATAPLRLT